MFSDARSYLNFSSAHPNHVYSGTVFSQGLRLRRIINCDKRLQVRLEELKECFRKCGYPVKMLNNIFGKVQRLERNLHEKPQKRPDEDRVRVISTYGSDTDIVSSVKKFEEDLGRTRSFSESDGSLTSTPNKPEPTIHRNTSVFQYVKRTGANLKGRLVKVKNLALGKKYGPTKPCKARNCKTCKMVSERDSFKINGKLVKTAHSNCSSYNIIYMAMCKCCDLVYIGRSTRQLNTRIGEHRRSYYEITDGKKIDPLNDDYSMGIHLTNHGFSKREDFDQNFNLCILEICSPKNLEVKEHMYIHELNTVRPNGINTCNPFGIRVLKT